MKLNFNAMSTNSKQLSFSGFEFDKTLKQKLIYEEEVKQGRYKKMSDKLDKNGWTIKLFGGETPNDVNAIFVAPTGKESKSTPLSTAIRQKPCLAKGFLEDAWFQFNLHLKSINGSKKNI